MKKNKIVDLAGHTFGYQKVIKLSHIDGEKSYWIYKCLVCGNTTGPIQQSHIKSGSTKACGCCKNVKETKIKNILEKLCDKKYTIKQGYRPKFLGLQHIDLAIFDDTKQCVLAIEYDGEQHYKPMDYFGGENAFKKQKQYDKRKNKLIKENKHLIQKFIRISYKEKIDEEKIIKILKENNIKIAGG